MLLSQEAMQSCSARAHKPAVRAKASPGHPAATSPQVHCKKKLCPGHILFSPGKGGFWYHYLMIQFQYVINPCTTITMSLQHRDQISIHKVQYTALRNISFWPVNIQLDYALQQLSCYYIHQYFLLKKLKLKKIISNHQSYLIPQNVMHLMIHLLNDHYLTLAEVYFFWC